MAIQTLLCESNYDLISAIQQLQASAPIKWRHIKGH
jgi:hypothetical protein